ncbi:MAG: hypothetical protein AVDCRST_MAG23-2264, partial [uncultured Sphingosinicella sp.]
GAKQDGHSSSRAASADKSAGRRSLAGAADPPWGSEIPKAAPNRRLRCGFLLRGGESGRGSRWGEPWHGRAGSAGRAAYRLVEVARIASATIYGRGRTARPAGRGFRHCRSGVGQNHPSTMLRMVPLPIARDGEEV